MQCVAFVHTKHEKYVNDWNQDFSRLRSITTSPAFGERLEHAHRDRESVVVYDPARKLSLLSDVLSAEDYGDYWLIKFNAESQTPCANPRVAFSAGKHGADVQNDKVLRYYP